MRIIPHQLCQLPAYLDFESRGCWRAFIGTIVGVIQQGQHVSEIGGDERIGCHVAQIARREPRGGAELKVACQLNQRLSRLLKSIKKVRPALFFAGDDRAVVVMEIAPPFGVIIHEEIQHFLEETVIFRFRPQKQGVYIDLLVYEMSLFPV